MDLLKISDKTFPTLLAITLAEQEQGLMYKKWPPPVMSFVYGTPRINKFWMYKTESPLDVVFCLNSKIISIHKGVPHSLAAIGYDCLSDLVIELPLGTCREYGIKIGDLVEINYSQASLMKVLMLKNGFKI